MDAETVRWILTGLMGVLMYLAKRMIDENKKEIESNKLESDRLRSDLENVKREYMHKDDFKDFKLELKGMFQEFKQDIKDSITAHK